MPKGVEPFDASPAAMLMPGLGALCAGEDAEGARIARDITTWTLAEKARIGAMGSRY